MIKPRNFVCEELCTCNFVFWMLFPDTSHKRKSIFICSQVWVGSVKMILSRASNHKENQNPVIRYVRQVCIMWNSALQTFCDI